MTAMAELGVVAFKLFTGGVAPPGMYPGVDDGQLLDALRRAAALGRPTTVHCEHAPIVDWETSRLMAEGRIDIAAWDDARPWYSEVAAAQNVALIARGHRGSGGDRARQLAPDGRGDRRRAPSRRRRLGRDVSPLPVHHQGGRDRRPASEVESADPGQRDGGVAVAAGRRGTRAQRRQRPCAAPEGPRPRCVDAVAGRGQRSPAVLSGVRHPGHPRPRASDHAGRRAGVDIPGPAVRDSPPARARSRSAPTPTSRSCRPTGVACSTPASSSTTSRRSGPRFTGWSCASTPSHTVLRGKLDLRRGQRSLGSSPRDGRHLTAETKVAA